MTEDGICSELRSQVFTYLDELRESGVTNMYGATSYVREEFGVGKREAMSLVSSWMRDFEARVSAGEVS